MRTYQITYLLTAACCLAGHLGWAQRAAVAPLPPVVQFSSPKTQPAGVPVDAQLPRQAPAPTATVATPRSWPQPVFLLNSHIIMSDLLSINPNDIADLQVYKEKSGPRQWQSLTENGLISITLKAGIKPKFKTKSLAAIRRQAKASGLVSFQLNGLPLEDTSLRVVTAAIAGLEVLHSDSETVINIRFAPPKPAPPLPPGSIRIRGVANR